MARLIFVMLISLVPGHARAGWFGDFCSRYLVADDPYQYETVSREGIDRRLAPLAVKKAWGKLEGQDATDFRLLTDELRRRDELAEILNRGGDQ